MTAAPRVAGEAPGLFAPLDLSLSPAEALFDRFG